MPKLLFITTTNLSTNPRLLKELKLAEQNGYECTFIGFQLGNWSNETELEHLKALKGIKTHYLFATKDQIIDWFFSNVVWKISTFLNKYFKSNLKLNAFVHNKRSWQISRKLKRLKNDFDMVIAHNLGALYPAYQFAQKHKIPYAFDIEDYHPGEKCSPAEKQRREFLMQKLVPKASYISYASPLIGTHSFKLLNQKLKQNNEQASTLTERGLEQATLINNSFSQTEFQLKESRNDKVQFVWFSQNITWGRGLEQMVPALSKYKDKLQLNLIGNKRQDFHNEFLKKYDAFINYVEPLTQNGLNLKLSEFDIGLAIEISNVDLNKDSALSNKLFAYAQSGLYILATDTSAQKQFIEEHNSLGVLSEQLTKSMEKLVSKIIDEVETIRANKKVRFEYAKQLAWENESKKLLYLWQELLK